MLIINNVSKAQVLGKTPTMLIMGTSAECLSALRRKGIQGEVSCVVSEVDGEFVYEVYDCIVAYSPTVGTRFKIPKSISKDTVVSKVEEVVITQEVAESKPVEEYEDWFDSLAVEGSVENNVEDRLNEPSEIEVDDKPKEKLPPKWVKPTPQSIRKGKLCRCKVGSNAGQIGIVTYVKREGKEDAETNTVAKNDTKPISQPGNIQGEMQLRPLFAVPDKVRIDFIDPKTVQGTFESKAVSAPLVSVTVTKLEFCNNWYIDANN